MRTDETGLIIIQGNRRRSLASCLTREAVTSSSEGRGWKSGAEIRAARWFLPYFTSGFESAVGRVTALPTVIILFSVSALAKIVFAETTPLDKDKLRPTYEIPVCRAKHP